MIFDNLQSQYDDPDFYAIQELTEKIEEALARLPENVREAFELNRFQNLTYNEIAERLGVSPKTIDYRIQQALKQSSHRPEGVSPYYFLSSCIERTKQFLVSLQISLSLRTFGSSIRYLTPGCRIV